MMHDDIRLVVELITRDCIFFSYNHEMMTVTDKHIYVSHMLLGQLHLHALAI